jgi:flagellar protein FlaJ
MGKSRSFQPWVFAHTLLGDRIDLALPYLGGLKENLAKSKIAISFKAYASLLVFSTMLTFSVTLPVVTILLFSLAFPPFHCLLYGFLAAIATSALTAGFIYLYPLLKALEHKANIESTLPFGANYMAIFAMAGVPPEKVFDSMRKVEEMPGLNKEAAWITRDVMIMGEDILTAMKQASERSPSKGFSELLDGYVTTARSGGSTSAYLIERARRSMEDVKLAIRRFTASLGLIAQLYVAVLIATPLIMIVLFVAMGMVGGALGALTPTQLLILLTYFVIPLASIIFLIWVHLGMPER